MGRANFFTQDMYDYSVISESYQNIYYLTMNDIKKTLHAPEFYESLVNLLKLAKIFSIPILIYVY